MFESWAAVNVGADKHDAELEERDKQGSRSTLLNSLIVKCTTLVVEGIFILPPDFFEEKKHKLEIDKGSRPTLLNSLQVKCTTLVVGGYFHGNIETFLGNMNFGKIISHFLP